jgi:2-keto-4-pentenoate hydratase/2-oxohepta-3-ene-1,7-dioic acid hydratase in catechol pathway
MKLLRHGAAGNEKPGLLDSSGTIRDLSQHVSDIDGAALSEDSLAKIAALDHSGLPTVDANTRLGACVGSVGKFICIGLNYADHAAESGLSLPEEPVVFF